MNVVDTGTNAPDLITRKEVARILHLSLPTVDKHTSNGILQSYRIGRRVLFRKSEIIPALEKIARAEAEAYE